MATYVIGDTHGCIYTLRQLLEDKLIISKNDNLFFLGDYIDRGLHGAQLIEYLINLRINGFNVHSIRGNHEQMLLDSISSSSAFKVWIRNTGQLTIESYKRLMGNSFKFPNDIPNSHLDFFNKMPFYNLVNEFILVHGGLDYTSNNPFGNSETILWQRTDYIPLYFLPGKIVLHGHTPAPIDIIMDFISNPQFRRIPLDGGCVYAGRYKELGNLVALNLESKELSWVYKNEND